MPIVPYGLPKQIRIFNRIADAFATNNRTAKTWPIQIDPPILRPLGNEMVYATHVLALAGNHDFVSGDYFKVQWKQHPGRISTSRQIKFVVPQADGLPWDVLIVMGTIDAEAVDSLA